MSVENKGRPPGKIRWRRFALVAVPAVAVAGTLVGFTAEGALASSISVSGAAFTITAADMSGTGFAQYGNVLQQANGTPEPVMESAMQTASMTNLCQSVTITIPVINKQVTMELTAGDAGTPVSAQNLIVDADSQTAKSATFTGITIGEDAGQITGNTALAGSFGEQAQSVDISGLRQDTWLTTAGTFTLPNLNLRFGAAC